MDAISEFLTAYGKPFGWKPDEVTRKLCETYQYSPQRTTILDVCYGWVWGKHGDEAEANAAAVVLGVRLREMHAVVAAENGW